MSSLAFHFLRFCFLFSLLSFPSFQFTFILPFAFIFGILSSCLVSSCFIILLYFILFNGISADFCIYMFFFFYFSPCALLWRLFRLIPLLSLPFSSFVSIHSYLLPQVVFICLFSHLLPSHFTLFSSLSFPVISTHLIHFPTSLFDALLVSFLLSLPHFLSSHVFAFVFFCCPLLFSFISPFCLLFFPHCYPLIYSLKSFILIVNSSPSIVFVTPLHPRLLKGLSSGLRQHNQCLSSSKGSCTLIHRNKSLRVDLWVSFLMLFKGPNRALLFLL